MTQATPIYLDNNATTPMDPRVLEEMLPYFLDKFGNAASRTHPFGWEAEEAVENAREKIASLIGAKPKEIIFTSGATEAINLALKGAFESNTQRNHIITVQTEHKAILDTCQNLENRGCRITYLPVNCHGLINLTELEAAINKDTLLIAVMYANNETGVIQPVKEIGEIATRNGVHFFSDATQAVGKIPMNVNEDKIDLMAFSAHKMYGPKGIGALYVRNLRSGTLNVPGIIGFGKACELANTELIPETVRLRSLRDTFESNLSDLDIVINGAAAPRLPHCTNITFPKIDGAKLMLEASIRMAFSQSSACTSATIQPSHVLKAMGLSDDIIHNSFRFSMGRFSSSDHVDLAAEILSKIVKAHRSEGN
jgi:cysteine desulfurase